MKVGLQRFVWVRCGHTGGFAGNARQDSVEKQLFLSRTHHLIVFSSLPMWHKANFKKEKMHHLQAACWASSGLQQTINHRA